LYWTAPELLRIDVDLDFSTGTQKGDIYSTGIIFTEIISRKLPYWEYDELMPIGKRKQGAIVGCPSS
jgi:serine/threonine protein kinase